MVNLSWLLDLRVISAGVIAGAIATWYITRKVDKGVYTFPCPGCGSKVGYWHDIALDVRVYSRGRIPTRLRLVDIQYEDVSPRWRICENALCPWSEWRENEEW